MNKIKTEIKWGVLFAIATLLWMYFEKAMGWHDAYIAKQALYTNFFAIIAVLIYVLALRDKRKNDFGGEMTWKQGFVSGIVLSIVIAVLSPLTQYITSTMISPEYFPNSIKYVVESGKMTQETAEIYFNLKSYILQGVFSALTMGVVTAALVAFFVKTK